MDGPALAWMGRSASVTGPQEKRLLDKNVFRELVNVLLHDPNWFRAGQAEIKGFPPIRTCQGAGANSQRSRDLRRAQPAFEAVIKVCPPAEAGSFSEGAF